MRAFSRSSTVTGRLQYQEVIPVAGAQITGRLPELFAALAGTHGG